MGLHQGEAKHALARAVCLNRRGEIRDRSCENPRFRALGRNLVVTAILLWNPVSLERAMQAQRDSGQDIDEKGRPPRSPLGWEHLNLPGD